MLNHFRTLLLNLSYDDNGNEHIPDNFNALQLASPFKEIYNILFPQGSSRYYRQFLANSYLSIIDAAGLSDELLKFDPRISYSLDDADFFKIYRYSNPAISSIHHPIFIYGNYRGIETNTSFYDNFLITQVDNTEEVLIYSTVRKIYINGNQSFKTPDIEARVLLDLSNGSVTSPVLIGSTGISFVISGVETFTDTSNKTWQFLVEAPFKFNINSVLDRLKAYDTKQLFNFAPKVDVSNYMNLWNQHFNDVYRLAGFLLAYVTKLDSTL
jgi:hypothetical protein